MIPLTSVLSRARCGALVPSASPFTTASWIVYERVVRALMACIVRRTDRAWSGAPWKKRRPLPVSLTPCVACSASDEWRPADAIDVAPNAAPQNRLDEQEDGQ